MVAAEQDVRVFGRVLDVDEPRRLPRRLQRLGDDGRDDLAPVGDRPGLEDGQLPIGLLFEPGRVLARQDGEHPGDSCADSVSTDTISPRPVCAWTADR